MTAITEKILVAGIGNIFLGDDAFGSEVARRLARRSWPDGVRVVDFGIRGLDLAYALQMDHELAILIDATPQGGPPGTLYLIEPELAIQSETDDDACLVDGHTLDPLKVLRLVRKLGDSCRRIVLVGCEPADLGGDEGRMGLSQPVEASLDEACSMVESLVTNHLASRERKRPEELAISPNFSFDVAATKE